MNLVQKASFSKNLIHWFNWKKVGNYEFRKLPKIIKQSTKIDQKLKSLMTLKLENINFINENPYFDKLNRY